MRFSIPFVSMIVAGCVTTYSTPKTEKIARMCRGDGCGVAAHELLMTQGGRGSLFKDAVAIYKKGCTGREFACHEAIRKKFENGDDVDRAMNFSKKLLAAACAEGDDSACKAGPKIYRDAASASNAAAEMKRHTKAAEEQARKAAREAAASDRRRVAATNAEDENRRQNENTARRQVSTDFLAESRRRGATHVMWISHPDRSCRSQLDGTLLCQSGLICKIGVLTTDTDEFHWGVASSQYQGCERGAVNTDYILIGFESPGNVRTIESVLSVQRGADTVLVNGFGAKLPAATWRQIFRDPSLDLTVTPEGH